MPKGIHQNLKWDKSDPFHIDDIEETLPWTIIPNETTGIKPIKKAPTDVYPAHYYVPAKGSQSLQTTSTSTGLVKDKCA